jgi:hypothetical protein
MTVLTFWSTDDQSWLKEIWDTTSYSAFESGYVFMFLGIIWWLLVIGLTISDILSIIVAFSATSW